MTMWLRAALIQILLPVAAFAAAPQSAAVKPQIGLRQAPTAQLSKPEIVAKLKVIQERQTTALEQTEKSMRKLLQESQSIRITGEDQVIAERQLKSLSKRMAALVEDKEELQLRYDFLSQIIFQIDSKWSTQPLATFLEQQLLDMAVTDLTSAQSTGKPQLWRFYTFLSIALREIPEKREDLIAFMDGYIDYSSIREPKSPAQYQNSRHYTNGAVNQTARPLNRESLEAVVDKRLKDLESIGVTTPGTESATTAPAESPPSIELRTKAAKQ